MPTPEQIKIYNHFRLPESYWDVRINELPDLADDNQPYKHIISDWVLNFKDRCNGKCLYLYGDLGRGKGACAALIMKAAAAYQVSSLWTVFGDLQNMEINRKDYMFSADQSIVERMKEVTFLVVDEFSIAYNQRFSTQVLENILRARNYQKKSTIIASNFTPSRLTENDWTVPLGSVIAEVAQTVKIHGKNFREKRKYD